MNNEEYGDGLGCCSCDGESGELSGTLTCADKKYVFTKREQRVLGKIREASLRARVVKDELRKLGPGEPGHSEALLELEQLRHLRAELEQERVAAAEERMRLLGHL